MTHLNRISMTRLGPLLGAILLLVLVLASWSEASTRACTPQTIRVRKEVRDLTPDEWANYKRAVVLLASTSDRSVQYDAWTEKHMSWQREGHNTPQFFPWHREYILEFEDALRRMVPNVTIPYWDWSYDSQDPLRSPVFDSVHYNFRVGSRGDCSWRRAYPTSHCLVRNYDTFDFGTFHDSATLYTIVRDTRTTYDRFRTLIEQAPHGTVHVNIGGSGGDMSAMMSPNDPIFWLHHAFIDKLWSDRQRAVGQDRYDGMHRGRRVSLDDRLAPFSVSVRSVLNHERDLCYKYQPFSRSRVAASEAAEEAMLAPLMEAASKLKAPKPVPDHWIDMCGYNKTEFREHEAFLAQVMENVNRQLTPSLQDPEAPFEAEVEGGYRKKSDATVQSVSILSLLATLLVPLLVLS